MLGTFVRVSGEMKAKAVMMLIVSEAIEFFNVGNSMNANQIAQTVDMILDSYGYLKIDDFKFCFNCAKKGMYGTVYRIDGNVILSWIEQYINDRINAADEMNYAQHSSMKMNEKRFQSFQEIAESKSYRK
jgi:hypothetical protein